MTTITRSYGWPTRTTEHLDLADDDTDSAEQLEGFIAAAPDGATIDLDGGRFHCESTVDVTGKKHLALRNGTIYALDRGPMMTEWGQVLTSTTDNLGRVTWWFTNANGKQVRYGNPRSMRKHWRFNTCTGLILDNLRAESTNTEGGGDPGYAHYDEQYEAEHAFEFNDCTGFEMVGCSAWQVWGDGANFGAGPLLLGCTRGLIEGNDVAWNGRQGMSFVWCDDLDVLNNLIRNSKRAAFDLEPNSPQAPLARLRFRGNDTTSINMVYPMRGHAAMTDISIRDHICREAGFPRAYCDIAANEDHPELATRSQITVDGWTDLDTSGGSDRHLFEFDEVAGVTVKNVTATLSTARPKSTQGRAVLATGCSDYVTVRDNRFTNGQHVDVLDPAPGTLVDVPDGQFA